MMCHVFGSLSEHAKSTRTITVPRESRCCSSKSVDSFCLLANDALSIYESIDDYLGMQTSAKEDFHTAALGWEHLIAIDLEGGVFVRSGTAALPLNPDSTPHAATEPDAWIPIRLNPQRRVVQLAAGEKHSLALTEEGGVVAWGSNGDGQLGVGLEASLPSHTKPKPVFGPGSSPFGKKAAKKIACGARHSCVVTQDGEVWCWGWSLHGQCATANPSEPLPRLVQALLGVRVEGVAAGLAHTVVNSQDGDVYSFGWNGDGQLGQGDFANLITPALVDSVGNDANVCKVSCGARHSVVLTDDGRAMGCGCNKHGELGLKEDKVSIFTELPLPALAANPGCKVSDVEAGWWHTVVLIQT